MTIYAERRAFFYKNIHFLSNSFTSRHIFENALTPVPSFDNIKTKTKRGADMNIFIENLGMGKESFEVLFHTASRLFANREIKLSELKSDADYTVKVSLNCATEHYPFSKRLDGVSVV